MLGKLLKIRISAALSSMFTGTKQQKKATAFWVFIGCLLGAVMIGYGAFIEMLLEQYVKTFSQKGLLSLYLSVVGLFVFAVSVLINLFLVQAQLYESKDINILLSLPIKRTTIVASRMIILLLLVYIIIGIIGIPAIIAYINCGGLVTTGMLFRYVIVMLCIGVLSLAVSCFLGWGITRIKVRSVYGNVLQIVLFAIAIAIASILVYVAINGLMYMEEDFSALEHRMKTYFYPMYCFGQGADVGDGKTLFILIAITIVSIGSVSLLIIKTFMKMVNTSHKFAEKEYNVGSLRKTTAFQSLVKKEVKLIFSEGMYFINAGMGIIFCIILAVIVIVKKDLIWYILQGESMKSMLPAILVLILCLVNAINVFSAPSLSLEGDCLWLPKSLPLSGKTILLSKVCTHCIVCILPTFLTAIVMNVMYEMSLVYRIYLFIIPIIMIVFMAFIGVLLNLKFPNFTFMNVTAAVKQSVSVLLAMILPAIGLGILTGIYGLFFSKILSVTVYVAIVGAFLVIADVAMYGFIHKNGESLMISLGEQRTK